MKYEAQTYIKVDPAQFTSSEQPSGDMSNGESTEKATTIYKGSKDEDVKRLQQALIDQGFLTGSANGQFGKMTEAAVKAAQKSFELGRVSKIPEAHFRRLKLHEVKIPLGFSVGCADRLGSITD